MKKDKKIKYFNPEFGYNEKNKSLVPKKSKTMFQGKIPMKTRPYKKKGSEF